MLNDDALKAINMVRGNFNGKFFYYRRCQDISDDFLQKNFIKFLLCKLR